VPVKHRSVDDIGEIDLRDLAEAHAQSDAEIIATTPA
jgi:hypothetical protein